MSNVDISALGQLKPSAPLDLTKYPAKSATSGGSKPKFVLPPAAEYKLRITTPVTNDTLKPSTTGNLNFKFDAEIVEGPYAGQSIRFQNASASTFTRDGVEQSMLGSLVAALGGTAFPGIGEDGDPTPQVRALEAVVTNPFTAYVSWEAEDRKFGTGRKVKGMKNFPTITLQSGETVHTSYFDVEGQKDSEGRNARVWANLYIANYVPAGTR